jgi:cell wall-associated NlpC family hydrolase
MNRISFNILLLVLVFVHGASARSTDLKIAGRIVNSVKQKFAPDKRTAIFDFSISGNNDLLILKGKTNLPEAIKMVTDSFSMLKINYRDSVQQLPDKTLGDKTWALITLSVASIRTAPDHPAEMATQALMGMPVKVLEKDHNWYRIQTPDQYIGWVDYAGIASKTAAEMEAWKRSDRYVFNQTNGYALDAPRENASRISDLVLCDIFEKVSVVKKYMQIRFPDGRTGYVKSSDCMSFEKWINQKPNIESVINVAMTLLGVPYLWGGTSVKALDCSGMVKTAHYYQGIILARDASQQAQFGEHLDHTNLSAFQPGDLLFFGKSVQRISHVGLYLGNDKYINAAGLVKINNINPNSSGFNPVTDRKDFVAAARVFNSIGTNGIVLVKNHPWYNSLPPK